MNRSHERGDAGAMQEQDMGSRSRLTLQEGDRMQMDIQVKYNVDCFVNSYKARLVAKGYAQTHGVDYEETFALEVIRTPAGIMISQRHYILNLLYKFGMVECKSVATPLD